KGCSRVPFDRSRFGPTEENARNFMSFISTSGSEASRRASTFWIIRNSKHDFSARVVRRGLLFCADSFIERQNLRHDRFDLPRVDELRDLCEVCRIRMSGDACSMNPAFLELVRIGAR